MVILTPRLAATLAVLSVTTSLALPVAEPVEPPTVQRFFSQSFKQLERRDGPANLMRGYRSQPAARSPLGLHYQRRSVTVPVPPSSTNQAGAKSSSLPPGVPSVMAAPQGFNGPQTNDSSTNKKHSKASEHSKKKHRKEEGKNDKKNQKKRIVYTDDDATGMDHDDQALFVARDVKKAPKSQSKTKAYGYSPLLSLELDAREDLESRHHHGDHVHEHIHGKRHDDVVVVDGRHWNSHWSNVIIDTGGDPIYIHGRSEHKSRDSDHIHVHKHKHDGHKDVDIDVDKDRRSSSSGEPSQALWRRDDTPISGVPGQVAIMSADATGDLTKVGALLLSTESGATTNGSSLVLDASTVNSTVMYLVTDASTPISTTSNMPLNAMMVEMHVPMYDASQVAIIPMCVTMDPNPPMPAPMSVDYCNNGTDDPHRSQKFMYEPDTGVISPLWSTESPASNSTMSRRDTGNSTSGSTPQNVTLVFVPAVQSVQPPDPDVLATFLPGNDTSSSNTTANDPESPTDQSSSFQTPIDPSSSSSVLSNTPSPTASVTQTVTTDSITPTISSTTMGDDSLATDSSNPSTASDSSSQSVTSSSVLPITTSVTDSEMATSTSNNDSAVITPTPTDASDSSDISETTTDEDDNMTDSSEPTATPSPVVNAASYEWMYKAGN